MGVPCLGYGEPLTVRRATGKITTCEVIPPTECFKRLVSSIHRFGDFGFKGGLLVLEGKWGSCSKDALEEGYLVAPEFPLNLYMYINVA